MDLVRDILLNLEDAPFRSSWVELNLHKYASEEVSYHIMLLAQAGLIEAINLSSSGGMSWKAKWLTWEGHEFLEASRDQSRWEKAKSLIKQKGGGIVFSVLKDLLTKLVGQAVLGT